jgi:hypothetical protein
MDGNELGKILFELVETPQGYAFISDSIEEMNLSEKAIINIAKNSREWTRESLKVLNKFIRKYDKSEIL